MRHRTRSHGQAEGSNLFGQPSSGNNDNNSSSGGEHDGGGIVTEEHIQAEPVASSLRQLASSSGVTCAPSSDARFAAGWLSSSGTQRGSDGEPPADDLEAGQDALQLWQEATAVEAGLARDMAASAVFEFLNRLDWPATSAVATSPTAAPAASAPAAQAPAATVAADAVPQNSATTSSACTVLHLFQRQPELLLALSKLVIGREASTMASSDMTEAAVCPPGLIDTVTGGATPPRMAQFGRLVANLVTLERTVAADSEPAAEGETAPGTSRRWSLAHTLTDVLVDALKELNMATGKASIVLPQWHGCELTQSWCLACNSHHYQWQDCG